MGMVEGYGVQPEGSRKDAEYWTFEMVQERIVEAVEFLDRHVPGGRSPYAGDGPWSQIIRDNRAGAQMAGCEVVDWVEPETDAQVRRRTGLRSSEVDRMNATLAWVEMLPPKGDLRKLVATVALFISQQGTRVSWLEVKRRMGSKHCTDTLRKSYSRSITSIARALSR